MVSHREDIFFNSKKQSGKSILPMSQPKYKQQSASNKHPPTRISWIFPSSRQIPSRVITEVEKDSDGRWVDSKYESLKCHVKLISGARKEL